MSNVTGITGNLCNKCPKQLVKQISNYTDYFKVISGFTSNSRDPGDPVTVHPPGTKYTPLPGKQTPAYGQRAAGTHPTGMHSCWRNHFIADNNNLIEILWYHSYLL